MKITYQEPTIRICDLSDEDIVSTSNIEDVVNGGEETPDEERNSSPFRQGIWYLLPYLMLLFTACSSDDEIVPDDTPIQAPTDMTKMTFRAIMEGDDSTSDNVTRAEFADKDANGTYHVHWQSGDKINILYSNQEMNKPFTLVGTDLAHGIFEGDASGNATEFTAVSPYQPEANLTNTNICNVVLPTLQKATSGSFDRYAGLLMGKASKDAYSPLTGYIDMYFKHVCCYIELKPTFDCQSIIISTRSPEEYLAGNLYLTYDQAPALDTKLDIQVDGLVNKVTLQGPIKAGETYYVAVLPGTLQSGIRVTCVDTEGKMVTKKKSSAVTLARANYRGYTAFLADPSTGAADEGVDLGTGVRWASQNLGATTPEELGDRFAWGETMPLYSYLSDDKYGAKYKSNDPTENEYDVKAQADPSSTYAGSHWRMPTQSDIQALIQNCTWEYVANYNNSGVEGYVVSGNNNQIFLPMRSGVASYWTSTLNDQETKEAYQLEINKDKTDKVACLSTVRRKSFYIRPVRTL